MKLDIVVSVTMICIAISFFWSGYQHGRRVECRDWLEKTKQIVDKSNVGPKETK